MDIDLSILRMLEREKEISFDVLVEASRVASEVLDGSDVMGESAYTLEVTSPGVDRPLTLPRHWRRNAGRLVRVTLDGGETLTGRIITSDDAEVTLDVAALSSAYLGGVPLTQLAAAGRVDGDRTQISALSEALRSPEAPVLSIWC